MKPADYVHRLQDASKRLREFDQVTVVLQVSYNLLSERMQERLRFLAVFPNTFDVSGAAALWEIEPDVAEESLEKLLQYSLLEFSEGTSRYHLHDLVRLFAGSQLSAEDREIVQQRHAKHYLQILKAAENLYLKGGDLVIMGLTLFDNEWSNIQAGQAWALTGSNTIEAAAVLCAEFPLVGPHCLGLRLDPQTLINWLIAALNAARRLDKREPEAKALGNLGTAYQVLGDSRRSIEFTDQALAIFRRLGDRSGEGAALGILAVAYTNLRNYSRAIDYDKQRLKIAREINDRRGEENSLGNLGNIYRNLGDDQQALEYYQQSLEIAQELGDRVGEGLCFFNSSLSLNALGDRVEAIARAEIALKIFEDVESSDATALRGMLAKWREEEKAKCQAAE